MKSVYFIKHYDRNAPKPTFAQVESDSLLERMAMPGISDLVKISEMNVGLDYRFLIEVKNSVYSENTEVMFRYDNHSIVDQHNNIVNIKIFSGIYRILSHLTFPYTNDLTGSCLVTTGNTINPLYNPPPPLIAATTQNNTNVIVPTATDSATDTTVQSDGHVHEYATYVGFIDTYDYCKICGERYK